MAKSIKGTQTEKNLLTSFAGESQARMRYTYFASVAKKEGYEQISAIFTETADQEKEHAKRMFKWLEGGMVEITASYPAGIIGTTMENLKAAAAGENEEWTTDYPHFADVADQEGFPAIATMSSYTNCLLLYYYYVVTHISGNCIPGITRHQYTHTHWYSFQNWIVPRRLEQPT